MMDLYSGTGVIRDTNRNGFVWEVYPDLTPPRLNTPPTTLWTSVANTGAWPSNLNHGAPQQYKLTLLNGYYECKLIYVYEETKTWRGIGADMWCSCGG